MQTLGPLGLLLVVLGQALADSPDCQYDCQSSGGCEVRWTGPSRRGRTQGSCFPPSFGGACSGTPKECDDCSSHCNGLPGFPVDSSGHAAPPRQPRHQRPAGGRGKLHCAYDCKNSGGCEVRWTGPPRRGQIKGSCFPPDFGGACSGTPRECDDCSSHCVASAPPPNPDLEDAYEAYLVYCETHQCGSNSGPPTDDNHSAVHHSVPAHHHLGGGGGGDDDCQYDCTDWPYSKCTMKWRSGFSSGSATCINPFTSRHGSQKFSNYPQCATIPTGCSRCDDHCARRDGRAGKEDY